MGMYITNLDPLLLIRLILNLLERLISRTRKLTFGLHQHLKVIVLLEYH